MAALPQDWDTIAEPNIFLSSRYLALLEKAPPKNMECFFIGLYKNGTLGGIALAQYIDLCSINPFGAKKNNWVKEYLFRRFSSNILIIGNNMLTGQNAYLLANTITVQEGLLLLKDVLDEIKGIYRKKRIKINLLAVKDFNESEFPDFESAGFKGYFRFCTQPNMIFSIKEIWASVDDYLTSINTKYRTQYNRARKKSHSVEKKKLTKEDIVIYRDRIYALYATVANNASFNTFLLPENHFEVFKESLQDDFLFYGYFIDNELAGFSTLIKNGPDMDTYFLGYDDSVQKEKMLYLNMLYDMVAYAIKKKFKHVILARSAMEIKSSVGAKAEEVYGIIKHTNPVLNLFMGKLFTYFDPKVEWKERNPFK